MHPEDMIALSTNLTEACIGPDNKSLSVRQGVSSETNLYQCIDPNTPEGTLYGTTSFKTIFSPYIEQYYPSYSLVWQEDKITKAFKLVQKLMLKKVVKEPKTIKDFIELVNLIADELY